MKYRCGKQSCPLLFYYRFVRQTKMTIVKLSAVWKIRQRANINIRPGRRRQNTVSAVSRKKRDEWSEELPPLLPPRQVTTAAERKDNCINLFPIRHRNSRSFGLITLLKDSTATPYHPVGLRFPIKFLEEQNVRSPAVHHRSLTLLNCDLHRRITAGRFHANGK